MKTLILNSIKIKKTQIKFYIAFLVFVILIKNLGIYTDVISFLGYESVSFALMAIVVFHFALFMISDQSLMIDDIKPYLLTLPISRKDLVNEKFLEVFLVSIIDLSLVVYLMHDVSIRDISIGEGLLFIFSFMAYYLLLIPANIKFRGGIVHNIILFGPAFLPMLDKIGVDPMEKVDKFYENTNPIIPFGMILIFIIIIYTISLKLVEEKDF